MECAIDADMDLFPERFFGDACCGTILALGRDVDKEAIAAAISCCCCVTSVFCTATLFLSGLETGTVVIVFVTNPRCCKS